jgi:hypothetical protein
MNQGKASNFFHATDWGDPDWVSIPPPKVFPKVCGRPARSPITPSALFQFTGKKSEKRADPRVDIDD